MISVEEIVKKIIYETVVKEAIERLFTAVPILGIPVVSQIISYFVYKIADLIYEQLSRTVSFSIIDGKTLNQLNDYEVSVARLKTVDMGDEKEVENAKAQVRLAVRNLVRFE